jgi:hypothetical protein
VNHLGLGDVFSRWIVRSVARCLSRPVYLGRPDSGFVMMVKRIAPAVLVWSAMTLANSFAATPEPAPRASSPPLNRERELRFLEDRVLQDPDDIIAQNWLAEIYLQRARDTGSYEWLRRAGEAARRSLASVRAEQNATGLFMQARIEY